MNEIEFKNWVTEERTRVERYLVRQGISEPQVGPWPAFEVAPYFAIWAVESKKTAGKIGWWAFSGDCPTDYVSEDGTCHPRSALGNLLNTWREYIPEMKQGRRPENCSFGENADLPLLGKLLESRVGVLEEWLANDDIWEDR